MSSREMLAAYWLPNVGIGPADPPPPVLPGTQTFTVPLTDMLNYRRLDGSLQIDIVNLYGSHFTKPNVFPVLPIMVPSQVRTVLEDGTVRKLQEAGAKVVLSIAGYNMESVGWATVPKDKAQYFADWLNEHILLHYGLDGIDIDDEYAKPKPSRDATLLNTVATMRRTFQPSKIISKALFEDSQYFPELAQLLSFGGIMAYGNDARALEQDFEEYVKAGMRPEQLTIGVNAGPVADSGVAFTSVETARRLAAWKPMSGRKMGMMLWSFSQDIQQFTADPQNQVALKFPNRDDHEWQRAIVEVQEALAES